MLSKVFDFRIRTKIILILRPFPCWLRNSHHLKKT